MSKPSIDSIVAAIPEVNRRVDHWKDVSLNDKKVQPLLAKIATQTKKHGEALTRIKTVADRGHKATSELSAAFSGSTTIDVGAQWKAMSRTATDADGAWKEITKNKSSLLLNYPRKWRIYALPKGKRKQDELYRDLQQIVSKIQEEGNQKSQLRPQILIPVVEWSVDRARDGHAKEDRSQFSSPTSSDVLTDTRLLGLSDSIEACGLAIVHLNGASGDLRSFIGHTETLLPHWDYLTNRATEIATALGKPTNSFDLRWSSDLPQRTESLCNEFSRYKSIGTMLFQMLYQHSGVTG
ncbi:hypothetical protein PIIN_09222 [Serendipita indica DSM 11827]|uniref:Uncharacterized protein n=1 Tax=Serendipita indica (strain DSM 11827) TaxID=1109443 RepID=G4TV95_SERID|nr:hypothetical protein PIIN_09222 [Serendipita indica DSM 11827]